MWCQFFFCLGDYAVFSSSFVVLAWSMYFFGIFVGQYPIQGRPTVDDSLVTTIRMFPEVQSIIYYRSRKAPEPQLIKKLILMLFGLRILDTYIETTAPTSTTDTAKSVVLCQLAFNDTDEIGCRLALQQDCFWIYLPLE
jgi:hypothetical protein